MADAGQHFFPGLLLDPGLRRAFRGAFAQLGHQGFREDLESVLPPSEADCLDHRRLPRGEGDGNFRPLQIFRLGPLRERFALCVQDADIRCQLFRPFLRADDQDHGAVLEVQLLYFRRPHGEQFPGVVEQLDVNRVRMAGGGQERQEALGLGGDRAGRRQGGEIGIFGILVVFQAREFTFANVFALVGLVRVAAVGVQEKFAPVFRRAKDQRLDPDGFGHPQMDHVGQLEDFAPADFQLHIHPVVFFHFLP